MDFWNARKIGGSIKDITINTPQGIGDIFWCYQKLSPYFDRININILIMHTDVVQVRAKDWLRLLPKVGDINLKTVKQNYYDQVIGKHWPMAEVLSLREAGNWEIDYAVNKPLEDGVRLEDIDPEYKVEWNVPIEITPCPREFEGENYICLYISGGTKNPDVIRDCKVWMPFQWAKLILGLYQRFKWTYPIILIGASYDRQIAEGMARCFPVHGIRTHCYIDSYPANVLYLIQQSKLFIGYQSGLNILADNMNVKQIMMYFPRLDAMRNSWPKKDHLNTLHFPCLFSSTAEEVVASLPDNFI